MEIVASLSEVVHLGGRHLRLFLFIITDENEECLFDLLYLPYERLQIVTLT